MTRRTKRFILFSPLFLLGAVLFVFLGGEIVRWLWNWLLPPLFGWHQITFWQALALLILCRILFGRLGGGRGGYPRARVRENMRRRMEERCANMTPEERERYRRRMQERWGFAPSTEESKEQ
jgi:hypothetical protein